MDNLPPLNLSLKWYFKQWFINSLVIVLSIIPFASILVVPLLQARKNNINKQIRSLIELQQGGITAQKMIEEAEHTIDNIKKSHEYELSQLEYKLANRNYEYQNFINQTTADANTRLANLNYEINMLLGQRSHLIQEIENLNNSLIMLNDEALYQSFALYQPQYNFMNVEDYKVRLDLIRSQQKSLIKYNQATLGANDWTVNNSKAEGRKLVNDTQKLLLRAFNNECDFAINKVNYRNFEASKKRIATAYTTISKLGRVMSISITPEYYNLKIQELHLAFEYEEAKQREKERLQEIREEQREQAKLKKELEAKRSKRKKEKMHYTSAISTVKEQIAMCTNDLQRTELVEKLNHLEAEIAEIDKSLVDLDYREANERAGYVYIISNIGAFGPDVYKIGMTRRLEPMDRINELGDASVPFKFDVHALIFSDDAPSLENALHHAFNNSKINMVNPRREFFHVKLEEIINVVKQNFDGTVEFTKIPEATQYRESLKLKELSALPQQPMMR